MIRKRPSQTSSSLNQIPQVDFRTGFTIPSLERREFLRRMMLGGTGCSLLPIDLLGTILTESERASQPVPLHPGMGMPGPFPGKVVEVKSPSAIIENLVNATVVQKMIEKGMTELTGAPSSLRAWQTLFNNDDIVGIKINASGVPGCVSSPEIINEVIGSLGDVGVPPHNIFLYERFADQIDRAGYRAYVSSNVNIVGIEAQRQDSKGYDKSIYLDRDFFGEDETRSYLAKLVTSQLTKIINIPCLKDHDAAGVTGCLKNIAYGSFNNVARSHKFPTTHTKTFIGQLANVEPLRSKTVLQIMDGLRGIYHGGPFAPNQKYLWFPGLIYFGTDPVAIDRIELQIIEAKRREVGAISLWDRSPERLVQDNSWVQDPNKNAFIREPGHIEYAASLGLGISEMDKIKHNQFILI
jgi:uncharacterized protein (DUF362 family)